MSQRHDLRLYGINLRAKNISTDKTALSNAKEFETSLFFHAYTSWWEDPSPCDKYAKL